MILTFLITDLRRGGSPLLLADLAPGLAALGWDVEVVSIAPLGDVADLLHARRIPTSSLRARFNRDLAVIPRLVRHLRARQPEIVCSILIHANLLASMARPLVEKSGRRPLWVQSIHTLQAKPAWHWTLQALLLAHADGFIAPSRAILRKVQSLGAEVPHPAVIPNGIDVARFYDARPPDHLPWPPGATVIGSIARFDPVKRLDQLIQALALLPEHYHLALVGYGAQEMKLHQLAGEIPHAATGHPLAARVHFPGRTAEPERWYKSFNIYCNLSSSEGFGLTLAEAACAGLAVVTCDTPAIRETLDGLAAVWLPADPTPAQVAHALAAAASASSGSARPSLESLTRRFGMGGPGHGMVGGYDAYLQSMLPSRVS